MAAPDFSAFGAPAASQQPPSVLRVNADQQPQPQSVLRVKKPDSSADFSQFGTSAPPSPTPPSPGLWGIPGTGPVIDFGKNVVTGLETAGADVLGMPRALQDFVNQYIPPDPGSWAANPNDPRNPPTQLDIRKYITGKTGLDYVPSTPEGRIVQKAAEFGGPGLLGGPLAAGFAATGGAAQQGAKEAGAPEWVQNTLGIGVPLLAHTGVSTARTLLRPMTEAGQMAAAQKVLNEVATNPNAPIGLPPLPNARQSLGQATGDPGLLSFEQHRFQSSEPMKTEFTKIKQSANEAGTTKLQTAGNFPNRAEAGPQSLQASSGMQQVTQDAADAADAAEHRAWQQVDPTNSTAFDTVTLKQKVDDYLSKLSKARQEYVPTKTVSIIQSFNPTEPLMELQDLRSTLSKKARGLRASGLDNEANVVEGLRNVVADHVDSMTMPTPDLATAYENARLLTRQLHETFDDKLVQRVLKSSTGSTAAGSTFMSSPEGFNAYFKATNGSPEAIQHAQDYFLAGLARKSLGTGDQMAAKSYVDYLNKPANRTLLNDRRLFTQDQADAIDRVAAQLDHTEQTGRAAQQMGGSQTYRLLAGDEQAKALVGKTGQTALEALGKVRELAGAGAGYLFGGPVGAGAGYMMSRVLPKVPYKQAGEKVLEYIDQALADPAFAERLRQMRPLPSTSSTLAPALKGAVTSGILGGAR